MHVQPVSHSGVVSVQIYLKSAAEDTWTRNFLFLYSTLHSSSRCCTSSCAAVAIDVDDIIGEQECDNVSSTTVSFRLSVSKRQTEDVVLILSTSAVEIVACFLTGSTSESDSSLSLDSLDSDESTV